MSASCLQGFLAGLVNEVGITLWKIHGESDNTIVKMSFARVCVCMCVCVCERDRQRECVCVRERECVYERERV